jgi:outer membrane protein insertion porin family
MIKAIEVEGLTRIKKEELIDMICLHLGDPVDVEILRDGIKRAFKKGIFLDIKAIAEPYETGIKLRYIVKEVPVIKHINVKGNRIVSKRKIKKSFIFKEGEGFKEGYIEKAGVDLLNFYHRKGFPDAKVKINIERDEIPNKVNITLLIEEGEPLIIKNINILPDIKSRLKISEGDIFDIDRVEKDIERLKGYYKKQKYIKPIIGPYEFKVGIDPFRGGELIIPVIPGQRLEVVFKGDEVFSSKELLEEVSFLEDEKVTGELLQEAADRIKKLYQKKGYYYAQVTGGIETEEELIRVIFFIFEGEKVILREIEFEGISISPDAIKAIIPLEENKPFDGTLLSDSIESIIRFYNALGYIHTDITEIRKNFIEAGSELNLVFVINEGPQVRIEEINITGNRVVSNSEIIKILPIRKEEPYNEIDIGDARYRVLSLYNQNGYIDAQVDVESIIDADKAFITFKITENEPSVFGKIIIRGNNKTKDKIIRREFVIKEGEPYNYEAIFKTRQRLYKLGLFTNISIEPLETSNFKRPEKENDKGREIKEDISRPEVHTQDVLVDLEEGNPGSVEMGLGYGEYEYLRGFFDIGYRNLGGYNRQIGLRTELSSIKKRYILNFREPWLFNKPSLPLNVFLTKENVRSVNLDTKDVMYKIDRISLLMGVDKEFTEHLRAGLNYEYSIVETTDVKPGVILSREDIGTLGISSISPSLFYDTRDNPFDPTSGSLKGVVLKFASSAFFSETEFIKAVLQSSWYFQMRKGIVFAFALKGGVAHGFGDSVELPIIERFFLGGRTTVRGYNQDTLGPKGAGDNPTGGNVFALANTELRMSLGRGFGMVTFIDSGNVWKRVDNIDSGLRYTVGLGLRYNTPIGPLRIDYGHKLNREEGDSAGEIHFSLGHAF